MPIGTAVRYLKRGDWQKAHAIVQEDDTELGCWAHGIVHMMEGDMGNARYWFRRAHREFPKDADPKAEIAALAMSLKDAAH
jgi:Flp pilus assembly protein TadD